MQLKQKEPEDMVLDEGVAPMSVETLTIESSQNEVQDSFLSSRRFQYHISITVYAGIVIASICIFFFIKKNSY